MKYLVALLLIPLLATPCFSAEISEKEVTTFFGDWLEAQNTGSYSNYAAMYASNFVGIRRSGTSTHKLNYDAWLEDRKRMFKKKMIVTSNAPEIKISGTTATVRFEQIWKSGSYKDKGEKFLILTLENGKLKIAREDMLFSSIARFEGKSKTIVDAKESNIKSLVDKENEITSKFTSLKDKDCIKLSKRQSAYFDNRRLDRSECRAPKNWRLFTVIGGERYWLEILHENSLWTTEDDVVTRGEYQFGHFQSVDFEEVEWRITKAGIPIALIFAVVAQDPDHYDINIYRFFIIKLTENTPRFCGVAKSAQEARVIADRPSNSLARYLKEVTYKSRQGI